MEKDEFNGRIIAVTGGSSGIGGALVRSLTASGCKVCYCARHLNSGLSEDLADGCVCDLSRPDAIKEWIGGIQEKYGHLDGLVNNVAFDGRLDFENVIAEEFDRFVAINLRAAVLTTHAALPLLRAGSGRSIVNLGTTNWMLGLSPFSLYSAAKSGLVGFTRALARELGPEYIRVNLVSPGWVMTERQLELYVSEEDKRNLLADQALPFLLEEKHIVPVIRFLLSSAAGAITGQNLVVDGGKLMQ